MPGTELKSVEFFVCTSICQQSSPILSVKRLKRLMHLLGSGVDEEVRDEDVRGGTSREDGGTRMQQEVAGAVPCVCVRNFQAKFSEWLEHRPRSGVARAGFFPSREACRLDGGRQPDRQKHRPTGI